MVCKVLSFLWLYANPNPTRLLEAALWQKGTLQPQH